MNSDYNGYILAGGRSSRMGTDKSLLMLGDTTLIQHVIGSLRGCAGNLFIVSANPMHEKEGLPVIPDVLSGCGPAGGILTALEHSAVPFNFIMSCDTPFIRPATIQAIMQVHGTFDITLPEVNGYPEPLCGIYSKACAGAWRRRLQGGMFKLTELISGFRSQLIPVTELNKGDEEEFFNINHPEDYQSALKKIKG